HPRNDTQLAGVVLAQLQPPFPWTGRQDAYHVVNDQTFRNSSNQNSADIIVYRIMSCKVQRTVAYFCSSSCPRVGRSWSKSSSISGSSNASSSEVSSTWRPFRALSAISAAVVGRLLRRRFGVGGGVGVSGAVPVSPESVGACCGPYVPLNRCRASVTSDGIIHILDDSESAIWGSTCKY